MWDKVGQYFAGQEAAHLVFRANNGILNTEDLQCETVIQASENAAAMMEVDAIVGKAGDNKSLGLTIAEITINKHMEIHYFSKLI